MSELVQRLRDADERLSWWCGTVLQADRETVSDDRLYLLAAKEIERLQSIVDQLPKDAEDNPVLLGHTILFHPDEKTCGYAHEYGDCKVMFMDAYGNKTLRPVAECYNSYSSAQAAAKVRTK